MTRLAARCTAASFSIALAAIANAQIKMEARPLSERAELSFDVPTFVMQVPDINRMKEEDAANGNRPYRYGAVIPTVIATDFAGKWETAEDGSKVWRVRVHSPGAYTIGLVFDKWHLPEGAQVFTYDDAHSEVFGAYTSVNNNPDDLLQVEPIAGDVINVEYVVPPGVKHERILQIGQVIHDYRNLRDPRFFEVAEGGGEGACLFDINCPEGANYQVIKRAAIRTLAGGALCSGAILNNTANDGTPYMLTANHCGNMTGAIFTFGYERSGCGSGTAPTNKTMSGSQLLKASSTYDSQLYRLNQNIPSNYAPYYAGWDRATTTTGPAVSIGHPGGGPKMISIDNNGASSSGSDWAATWNVGMLEGGSSGGPLFNGNKRVIGPACCVNNFSCGSQTAWYGKFGSFWNTGLAQWLDPIGSNPTFVDGFDPAVGPPTCGSITTNGTGCAGSCSVTPAIAMSGCLDANGQISFDLTGALGGQTAFLFLGLSGNPTPLGCGCNLNASLLTPVVIGPLPLFGIFCSQGAISIDTTLPPTTSPGTVYLAAACTDNSNPCGVTTTNGLKLTFQ